MIKIKQRWQKGIKTSLVLSLLLWVSFLPISLLAMPIVSVKPSTATVMPGGNFSLDIAITGVTYLFSVQFDIGFNPSILSAGGITEGAFLPGGGSTFFIPGFIDNIGGSISFTADSLLGMIPGVSGNGILATIGFTAIGMGTSVIAPSNIMLLDSSMLPINFTSQNGNVNINVVPEPAGILLFGSGIISLYLFRKRKTVI